MKSTLGLLSILSITPLLMTGCPSSSSSTAPSSTTSGGGTSGGGAPTASPLTVAEVTGSHVAPCFEITNSNYGGTFGSGSPGSYYFTRYIYLESNNVYNLDVKLYYGTNCTGGTELFEYVQYGTFALGQLNAAGATEISYTTDSSASSILDAKGGAAMGVQNATVQAMNQACFTGGSATSPMTPTNSDSLEYVQGETCDLGGQGINLPTFPTDSETFYDVVELDSTTSPTEFIVSTSANIFHMGQSSSYPTGTPTMSYAF